MLNLSLFSKPLVSACRSYIVIHCESPSICRRAPGECTGVCQAVKKLQLRLRRFVRPSYSNEMLICGLLREFIRAHNIYGTLCIARSAARNLYKLRNPPSTFLTCGRVRFPLSSPCVEIHCAGCAFPPHPASRVPLSLRSTVRRAVRRSLTVVQLSTRPQQLEAAVEREPISQLDSHQPRTGRQRGQHEGQWRRNSDSLLAAPMARCECQAIASPQPTVSTPPQLDSSERARMVECETSRCDERVDGCPHV
jgi:hypothetical protein